MHGFTHSSGACASRNRLEQGVVYKGRCCSRLRRRAGLTLLRSCFDGRVKALMWRRSSSGIVHHGTLSDIVWVPTASSAVGVAGEWVYMTQYGGRGATSPSETEIFESSGRSSKQRTACLAASSASSLPVTFVWARTFLSMVVKPEVSLSRMISTMWSRRVLVVVVGARIWAIKATFVWLVGWIGSP